MTQLTPIQSSGVVTIAQADNYFGARVARGKLVTESLWPASMATAVKEAYLRTAEIELTAAFEVILSGTNETHVKAVCEQVLFHLIDPGAEARAALQAQGVTQAGVVQESYQGATVNGVLVAPFARSFMGSSALYSGSLCRPDLGEG